MKQPKRPAIVIRSIEAEQTVEVPTLTAARYAEQLRKLAQRGVHVPVPQTR
jgi:hypothetical protein